MTTSIARQASGRSVLRTVYGWHRPLILLAAALAVVTVVGLVGIVVDDRLVTGLPAWVKPTKFAISVGIYAVSWAWLIALVREHLPERAGRRAHRLGTVVAVLAGLELVLIIIQAARGQMSHFNNATAFDATLFSVMGVSIVAVWLATLYVAAQLCRVRGLDPARALAIRAGALLSAVGAALAFLMTGPKPGQIEAGAQVIGAHTVGLPDGGPGLAFLGWSTVGGDLRIPHFVGLHALQALPFLAIGLELLARRFTVLADARIRLRLTATGAAGYTAILVLVTWQALRGQSIVAPDLWTLLAFTAIVLGVATATAGTLLRRPATFARGETAQVPIRSR